MEIIRSRNNVLTFHGRGYAYIETVWHLNTPFTRAETCHCIHKSTKLWMKTLLGWDDLILSAPLLVIQVDEGFTRGPFIKYIHLNLQLKFGYFLISSLLFVLVLFHHGEKH